MDLSILICTCNGDRTIRTAVQRCLQELGRWTAGIGELIVVDNGSTDSTVSIVEHEFRTTSVDSRILNVPKPGKNHAFEAGVRASKAGVICIIDDDNFIEPGFCEHVAAFFADYPDVGIVGADRRLDESIQPPDWFALAADHLACLRPPLQENVEIDSVGREVADTGYIAGAGLSFRKRPLLEALDSGYRFFNDAVRGKKLSGEDMELCFLFRSMGYRFGYDPRIRLSHCIDPKRLTPDAFWSLCEMVGAGSLGIDPFMFTKKMVRGRLPMRCTWQWQWLAKARQLVDSQICRRKSAISPEARAFVRRKDRHQAWGAMRRILSERGRYNDHIRHVASGPWTHLRVK